HSPAHGLTLLERQQGLRGSLALVRHLLANSQIGRITLRVEGYLGMAPAMPVLTPHKIGSNRIKPGRKLLARIEFFSALIDPYKSLLGDVGRILLVAQTPEQEIEQSRGMPFHQI